MLTRLAIKVLTLMSQLSVLMRKTCCDFLRDNHDSEQLRLHVSAAHEYADMICSPTRSRGLKHHAGTDAGTKAD